MLTPGKIDKVLDDAESKFQWGGTSQPVIPLRYKYALLQAGAQAYADTLKVDDKLVEKLALTDEEILFEINCSKGVVDTYDQNILEVSRDIRKAQLNKVLPYLAQATHEAVIKEREKLWGALGKVGITLDRDYQGVLVKGHAILKPDEEYQREFWQALSEE